MVPGDFSLERVTLGDFYQCPRFLGDLVFQVYLFTHIYIIYTNLHVFSL